MYSHPVKHLISLSLVAVITLTAPILQAEPLSDALGDFRAQLFAYFKNQPDPFLPIFLPAGEVPGDVYRDAFGGYFARQRDCFKKLDVSKAPTHLPAVLNTRAGVVSGQLKGQLTEAAAAGANAGWKVSDRVEISFSDITVHVSSDTGLRKAFLRSEPTCDPVGKLMDRPGDGNSALVLGQVFIGKQVIETSVQSSLSGQIGGQASLEKLAEKLGSMGKALEKIGVLLKTNGKIELTGNREAYAKVSLTDKRLLPIGYRPAFLSQRHLLKVLRYIETGVLANIENEVIKNKNTRATADKYRDIIISPKRFATEIASGDLIPFDPKNKDHIAYLRGVGLIFSVGTDARLDD